MARSPDIRINEAYELFRNGMKLVEIASQLNLPAGTVRRWKSTHNWNGERSDNNNERSKRSKGGQPGNRNATGPPGNKNAEKHGLFSKYLPEETLELMNDIKTISHIDLLWDQIMIQYAAIIRSQKIMHVVDKEEMIKELKKKKAADFESGSSLEEEWNFQFAWDRQATFLTAQSRAMAELRNLSKQYDELLKSDLATEEQKLRVQKLRTEISILKGEGQGNDQEGIDSFIKATSMTADEIKAMFEGDYDENITEEE